MVGGVEDYLDAVDRGLRSAHEARLAETRAAWQEREMLDAERLIGTMHFLLKAGVADGRIPQPEAGWGRGEVELALGEGITKASLRYDEDFGCYMLYVADAATVLLIEYDVYHPDGEVVEVDGKVAYFTSQRAQALKDKLEARLRDILAASAPETDRLPPLLASSKYDHPPNYW